MSHPFRVDGHYRNLKGAFIVESLQGSRMMIRYEDGRTETTSTTFQELALLPDELVSPGRAAGGASSSSRTFDFQGLKETDFQESTAGTSWRRRASLGGLLAHRLSGLCAQPFESLGVSRRNEVYVYQPHRYRQDKTLHAAKLRFKVGPDGVRHGFYVEKDSTSIDAGWDWSRLLALTTAKSPVGGGVVAAMHSHQLVWRLDLYDHAHAFLCTRHVDPSGDCLALRDEPDTRPMNWDAFLGHLAALPTDEWCDLYLEQSIPREKAMRLGVGVADHAARVWRDLTPIYRACTVPSRR